MGFDWALSLMPYGTSWRQHRKVFHQYFYPNAAAEYIPKQLSEARKTLLRIVERPEEFRDHIRLYVSLDSMGPFILFLPSYFSASILNIVYGIKVDENKNMDFVHCGETAMQGATIAGVPGAFLVDILPIRRWFPLQRLLNVTDRKYTRLIAIVKYVPSWFPGAKFKKTAMYYRRYVLKLVDAPEEFVKNELV